MLEFKGEACQFFVKLPALHADTNHDNNPDFP